MYRQDVRNVPTNINQTESRKNLKFDKGMNDSTLPALAGILVLNFENDLTKKCSHYVSCYIYQHIFFFGHHRYHNHFVPRVDCIYHFCRLKNQNKTYPYEHFVLNVFPVVNFRRSLLNANGIRDRQTGCTDGPSRDENGGQLPLCSPFAPLMPVK